MAKHVFKTDLLILANILDQIVSIAAEENVLNVVEDSHSAGMAKNALRKTVANILDQIVLIAA